ncbi:MAG: HPr kinase/phosphorylase, partial [uncultured Acetobacteraceae bacterium]
VASCQLRRPRGGGRAAPGSARVRQVRPCAPADPGRLDPGRRRPMRVAGGGQGPARRSPGRLARDAGGAWLGHLLRPAGGGAGRGSAAGRAAGPARRRAPPPFSRRLDGRRRVLAGGGAGRRALRRRQGGLGLGRRHWPPPATGGRLRV